MEDNHNLIYSFLAKYRLAIEEHYGLAAIGLCKAGITYKGDKSKFSTYAYKCMFNSVMCELRKELSTKRLPKHKILYYQAELEHNDGKNASLLDFIPSNEDVENNTLSKVLLDEYAKTLSDRDKRMLVLLSDGYKQREISKIVGCSQPQVSRFKKKLSSYLTS